MMTALFVGLLAWVQDATPEKMDQWVKDLGSEDFKVREQADKSLRAAGRDAVPYLDKALKSEDLEVRERAQAIKNAVVNPSTRSEPNDKPQVRRRPPGNAPANFGLAVWVHVQGDDPYELKMGPDSVELTKDGKTYSAPSAEEFRKRYPDLYEKYVKPNAGGVRVQVRPFNPEPRIDKPKPGKDEPDPIEDPFFGLDDDWKKHLDGLQKMIEELNKAVGRPEDDMEKWLEGWTQRFEAERKSLERSRKELVEKFRRSFEAQKDPSGKPDPSDGVSSGRLGLLFDVVDDAARAKYKLGENEGVVVLKVVEESVAGRLGLKAGDILTRIGETPIGNALQARAELRKALRSEQVEAEVIRDGEKRTLKAKSADLRD